MLCFALSGVLSACTGTNDVQSGVANGLGERFNEYSYTLSLTMPGQSGVSFQNEKSEVRLDIKNISSYRTKEGTAKFTFTSVYGGEPFSVTQSFSESSEGENADTAITIPVKTDAFGYWTVDVDLTMDGNTIDTVTKGYCVVNTPQSYGKADSENFFGVMGIHNNPLGAERIGVKMDRPCAYWRFMRDANGQLQWDGLDEVLAYSTGSNIGIVLLIQPEVLLFGASLPGVEIAGGGDLIRADILTEYDTFLTETIRRYKDKIAAIEIVNEPDINLVLHSDLTPEKAGEITAEIMSRSYRIVKAEASEMPVLGMSVSEREYFNPDAKEKTMTEQIFAAAKGATLMDIFSIHPYSPRWTVSDKKSYLTPEEFGLHRYLTEGLAYIKNKGVSKAWVTEIGFGVEPREALLSSSRKMQAALVARSLVITKSFPDIEKGLYFSLCHGDVGSDEANMALFGPSLKYGNYFPYMGAATYSQVAYMLNGTKPAGVIKTGEDGAFSAYQFTSAAQTVVVIWKNREAQEVTVNGVPGLKACDMFGNKVSEGDMKINIGDFPIYLTAEASHEGLLADTIKGLGAAGTAGEEG